MSRVVYPAVARWRAADDGDEHRFCSTCAFSQACLAHGMNKAALRDLHLLVEHVGPIKPGQHVFRAGDPFEAIAAVARARSRPGASTARAASKSSAFTCPARSSA